MPEMSKEHRLEFSKKAIGKAIKSLEWDDKHKYWVMEFTDGSELCFRLMAELCT